MVLKHQKVSHSKQRSLLNIFPNADADEAKVDNHDYEVGENGTTYTALFEDKPHLIENKII